MSLPASLGVCSQFVSYLVQLVGLLYIYTVFPTHILYLGGPPRYINGRPSIFGDTFLF